VHRKAAGKSAHQCLPSRNPEAGEHMHAEGNDILGDVPLPRPIVGEPLYSL
jgi:hypothetical protein